MLKQLCVIGVFFWACFFGGLEDESMSKSLQHAWERNQSIVSATSQQSRQGDNSTSFNQNKQLSPEFCAWFIGFVSGKTGFDPPVWWCESLKTSKLVESETGFTFLSTQNFDELLFDASLQNGDVELTRGQSKLSISKSLFEDLKLKARRRGGADKIYLCNSGTNNNVFVCIYNDKGFSFDLFCIDVDAGDIVWSQRVGGASRTILLGSSFQDVTITARSKAVVVWGAESSVLFFEAFDALTGKPAYRFSSAMSR